MEESESYIVWCSDFTTHQCCLQGRGTSSVSRGSAGFLEPYTKTESQAGCSCYSNQWWKWFYWRKGFPLITNVLFLVVLFSHYVVSDSLWPHWLQHARLLCPLLSPGACSDSCPLSRWCHPTISLSVTPFFSCSNRVFSNELALCIRWPKYRKATVLLMNIQGWFPLGLTGLISLQSKGLSRIFSSMTIWKHQGLLSV